MKELSADNSLMSINNSPRFEGLEGVRAVMALWVVFGHVGNFMGYYLGLNAPSWMKLLLLTNVPVNIFISLSGFVIFQMLYSRSSYNLKSYYINRARRILPIYYLSVFVALLMINFRYSVETLLPWQTSTGLANAELMHESVTGLLYWHLIAHISLLHGLIPEIFLTNASQSILAPAWSLSLEWQFYLIAPIIVMIVNRGRWYFFAIIIALFSITAITDFTETGFTNAFFLASWPYFALGWWSSYILRNKYISNTKRFNCPIVFSLSLIFVSIIWLAKDFRPAMLSIAIWLIVFVACCKIIPNNPILKTIDSVLSLEWLVSIGKRSYSLYLTHILVIDIIGYLLIRLGLIQDNSPLNCLILLVIVVPLALALSWGTYSKIESRFMKKSVEFR